MPRKIRKVIPSAAVPPIQTRTVNIDGREYLELNDAMHTFYRRTMGELSPFFLAIRDEKRIIGAKCTGCGIVRVPPMAEYCPDCDFAPTDKVEVGDKGKMLFTPPITYFANSMFQEQVPFGRGRVVLDGADTALSINLYTTTGILVPGIFKQDTEIKIVFRDKRIGRITDIFGLPAAELGREQLAKKGLLESEIDWEAAVEPKIPAATAKATATFEKVFKRMKAVVTDLNECERAKKDIEGWKRIILVKAPGGKFVINIDDGDLSIKKGGTTKQDFTMVARNPDNILKGLAYEGSLTEAIMKAQLWISKNVEFMTVFKLERMARSLARSRK
ncbi:MAG: SCP2 sterol-binding domain-containing protein [Candidatus Hydrogenedentota bacterium]|nr:MAG: SCP2 sterol-binding domain-containing protein [Candidatus Hydrogenedentota bacterium]